MTAKEPLTLALAEAAARYVGASKIGPRRGSATAVAKAMTERGVVISSNTLTRKIAGEYPLNSDELSALAAVVGVDPDDIWAEALRILHRAQNDADLSEGLSRSERAELDRLRDPRAFPPSRPVGEGRVGRTAS